MDSKEIGPRGHWYPTSSRVLLDADADNGSGLGGGGGGGTSTAEPVETSADRIRATPDLSGLSSAELNEVPDIMGGAGGASTETPAAATTGTATPPAPTPADPNIAAGTRTQTPPPAQTAAPTLREVARGLGLDLSAFPDDQAAIRHLIQANTRQQNDDYYTQLGRQLAPHYREIAPIVAAKATPAPAQTRPAYMPPEFDKGWLNRVEQDPKTGAWKALPGQDPQYADKVQQYADWMAKFNENPMAVIQPAVEERARAIAAEVYQQQAQATQAQASIAQIVEGNAPWLYQANEQGARFVDSYGRYVPSPMGARYLQHVQSLGASGVTDPRSLDTIAKQMLRGEFDTRTGQALTAAAPPATATQTRAATSAPIVNANQAVEASRVTSVAHATPAEQTGMSLFERLRADMLASGVSDADVSSSAAGAWGN